MTNFDAQHRKIDRAIGELEALAKSLTGEAVTAGLNSSKGQLAKELAQARLELREAVGNGKLPANEVAQKEVELNHLEAQLWH